jgi:hypothetical protein
VADPLQLHTSTDDIKHYMMSWNYNSSIRKPTSLWSSGQDALSIHPCSRPYLARVLRFKV